MRRRWQKVPDLEIVSHASLILFQIRGPGSKFHGPCGGLRASGTEWPRGRWHRGQTGALPPACACYQPACCGASVRRMEPGKEHSASFGESKSRFYISTLLWALLLRAFRILRFGLHGTLSLIFCFLVSQSTIRCSAICLQPPPPPSTPDKCVLVSL